MKRTNCLVIISVLLSVNVFGQGALPDEKSFFPLKIGNYWQFKRTYVNYNNDTSVSYENMEIMADTLFSNIAESYYVVKASFTSFHSETIRYLRFDSLQISIIENRFGEENILFKLNASKYDCWNETCCNSDSDSTVIFGEKKFYKDYIHGGIPSWGYSLAKDIGPFVMFDDESHGQTAYTKYELTFTKIDGKEYGSYVTSVENNSYSPKTYSLSQNYPNPFNPGTKIKYSIPQTSFVTLKIYDLLGREVTILVNEEKTSGNYEIEFNGSSLSSGIYFYKILVGNYSSVKKMMIVK